jgi:ABC-type multidrug transport system ATPase subunit
MEGFLKSGSNQSVELPKLAVSTIGVGPDYTVSLSKGIEGRLAEIEWDRAKFRWVINRCHPDSSILLSGGLLPFGVPVPLEDGAVLRIGPEEWQFILSLARPEINGRSLEVISLKDRRLLVFGRGPSGQGADGSTRICLDAEDARISTNHCTIENREGRWLINDTSRIGTFLNEMGFKELALVYGDRFRIGDYAFEFLVTRIRRLRKGVGGEIQARGLTVSVQKPQDPVTLSKRPIWKRLLGQRNRTVEILSSVNLDIQPGQFVGILGGSGQGKSTLMNALCGIRPATAGQVYIDGVRLSNRKAIMNAGIGYVPQDDIVHRELTVEDALLIGAKLRLKLPEEDLEQLVSRVIENLSLSEHRSKEIRRLSGGQRKRVSIATELLSRPSVLFLDEPSSGLDPATEEDLMTWLQSLAKTGMTVVCTTHMLENAHLFDRILVVHGGRLIFNGTEREAQLHFLAGDVPQFGAGSTDSASASQSGSLRLPKLFKLYQKLKKDPRRAEDWEELYHQSSFSIPLAESISPTPSFRKRDSTRLVNPVKTLWMLLARQWKVLAADPLNIAFLLAQSVLIGLLVGWVADGLVLRGFLAIIATMWFGCSNGAQQIVGELPIFRRERVSGQGLAPYIASKFLFLTTITSIQAILLVITMYGTAHQLYPRDFGEGKGEHLDEVLAERLFPRPLSTRQSAAEIDSAIEPVIAADAPGSSPSSTRPAIAEAKVVAPGLVQSSLNPAWKLTVENPADWRPGAEVTFLNGEKMRLPANAGPYPSLGIVAARTQPGRAASPFVDGVWASIDKFDSENKRQRDFQQQWTIQKKDLLHGVTADELARKAVDANLVFTTEEGCFFDGRKFGSQIADFAREMDRDPGLRRVVAMQTAGDRIWRPGGTLTCPVTMQPFHLPREGLAPWVTNTFRFRLVNAFARYFMLEDAVLQSSRRPLPNSFTDLAILSVNRGISRISSKDNSVICSIGRETSTDRRRFESLGALEAALEKESEFRNRFREIVADATAIPLLLLFGATFGLLASALFLTAISGVSIGLAVSALVQNPTQAVMWVPLVLIPQILFGGFVVIYPEMPPSVGLVARGIPSFAAQRIADVAHVFGRSIPKVSNESRVPYFFSGGQREIRWLEKGKHLTQRYDESDEANVSWQNLLINPASIGRRKVIPLKGNPGLLYSKDAQGSFRARSESTAKERSLDRREDLLPYFKAPRDETEDAKFFTRYEQVGEAAQMGLVLCLWSLGCVILITIALPLKQTG